MTDLHITESESQIEKADFQQPALEVASLSLGYHADAPALWDVSLKIPKGALVGIFGPNGAGKSTFVKACVGLIQPLSGQVFIEDCPISESKGKVAYVPQKGEVDWGFPVTAFDVVLMGCYPELGLFKRPKSSHRQRALAMLERVGMLSFADRHISHLSEGQKQRVFIARMLMQEADIYFLDEPFAGIDMTSERVIFEQIKQLKNAGKTVIIVHHNLMNAPELFDWSIFFNVRLCGCGPIEETFCPEILEKTFGPSVRLLSEATRLSKEMRVGRGP
jgi:manganese/zinc/iron transport system ATP- binding protein